MRMTPEVTAITMHCNTACQQWHHPADRAKRTHHGHGGHEPTPEPSHTV